ncbi:MAG: CPBP family glutamic-type intramembrane protease [Planctomycetes bacterium]|nr:CPBP family glutamic-type intramembrane protease [Planctomycetota bacterium]MCR4318236.1 CPBP family glutamic-type intramembrane protease [Planctomycetota bacterium]
MSYLYVMPVLVLYTAGLSLASESQASRTNSIADLFLWIADQFGHQNIFNALIFAGIFVSLVYLKKTETGVSLKWFPLVLVESVGYSFLFLAFATFYSANLLSLGQGEGEMTLYFDVVLSFGAGIYEELFFRLILLTGLVNFFRFVMRRDTHHESADEPSVYILAIATQAILFSLAHHFVRTSSGGLDLVIDNTPLFVFRAVCGVLFASLFLARGFAVAVYTHVFYDVIVTLINRGIM